MKYVFGPCVINIGTNSNKKWKKCHFFPFLVKAPNGGWYGKNPT